MLVCSPPLAPPIIVDGTVWGDDFYACTAPRDARTSREHKLRKLEFKHAGLGHPVQACAQSRRCGAIMTRKYVPELADTGTTRPACLAARHDCMLITVKFRGIQVTGLIFAKRK